MTDVTIRADVAKDMAGKARAIVANLRSEKQQSLADFLDSVADLLDPQPPTLRQVSDFLSAYGADSGSRWGERTQRDADVAWLQGEQS